MSKDTEQPSRVAILGRAVAADEATKAAIRDMFEYHSWDEGQTHRGHLVREALIYATISIVDNVPPCSTRDVALRKLFEARMDCNAAITHNGKY